MDDPNELVDRLLAATNDHDLDAITACFAVDYENVTPAHPSRGFTGRDQVRRNWDQILRFVPDLHAEVVARAADGSTVFTERAMTGTRLDGTPHDLRGVIVFGVADGRATWARFYLEPVDPLGAEGIDDAVRDQVAR